MTHDTSHQAATEWQAIFDSIRYPVMLLSPESLVLRANAASQSLLNAPDNAANGIVGQFGNQLLPGMCANANCLFKLALLSKRREETEFYDEKRQLWIRETVDPILDESRNVTGLVLSMEDITERKLGEVKLCELLAEIETLRKLLQSETEDPPAGIRATDPDVAIAGQSEAIKNVLRQVRQVSPTNSAVLICGETGTGKELVAEAIHSLSPRKARPLVKVNCAALPAPLVESELFGREKGAYTGALARQAGRFEIADRSSIFLDEVGELSLEVQAKLLRVLQEGQFERLGSPKTLKVNVRLIAATNRDLADEVRKGRFRQDLYYRLNVFPMKIPPLRERAEDIPVLVWTFVRELSARMGKKVTRIPSKTMEELVSRSWAGNVRELRNVIERGIITSHGETLRIAPLQELQLTEQPVTLADHEREHIVRILGATLWHIKGPSGAAVKLGLKPSTLYTRMQKLGIPNRRQRDGIRTERRHAVR